MIDRVNYERWTRIKDYPDYLVSTFGRIKSFRTKKAKLDGGQIIKGGDSKGYRNVRVFNRDGAKTVTVHRLVANTFIPNPDNKEQVNHIDGDKANNKVNNLEWNTHQENNNHAFDNGLQPKPRMAVVQFTRDGNFVREFESVMEAKRQTGVDNSYIAKVCRGRLNHAGNYIWRYKNN